jgi:hypothetical protein
MTSRRSIPNPSATNLSSPGTIMNEECVGVATGTDGQRLTGSDSDHVNRDTACRSENRQDMAE